MILSGSAVQTNGIGCWLWSTRKRLMQTAQVDGGESDRHTDISIKLILLI
jgi:hypothetical protein